MSLPSEEHSRRMAAASQAQHAAKRILIDRHSDEYEQLLGDEREKRGLPRVQGYRVPQVLLDRIAELEAQLREREA